MQTIYKVPVQAYDIATGELVSAGRYLHGQPMDTDLWHNQMLEAQRDGKRIAYSNEWSGAQRYQQQKNPEFEARFVDTAAWTGTVMDFNDETLKEGLTLNEDGTIAKASVVLGKKDKIVVPHSSAYVKDLDDRHMPLISYLQGVKNPKRELPNYAYIWVTSCGIRPAVRGYWTPLHVNGRVDVGANYGPALRRFAAWLIDEQPNILTSEQYTDLERRVSARKKELETELATLEKELASAAVLL